MRIWIRNVAVPSTWRPCWKIFDGSGLNGVNGRIAEHFLRAGTDLAGDIGHARIGRHGQGRALAQHLDHHATFAHQFILVAVLRGET